MQQEELSRTFRRELAEKWSAEHGRVLSADEIMGVWNRHPDLAHYWEGVMQCVCHEHNDSCTCGNETGGTGRNYQNAALMILAALLGVLVGYLMPS